MGKVRWARVSGPLAPYAEEFRIELQRLGYQGSGHGVIFRVWSGPGFDLVAQDEISAGVAGFGGGEVLAELGDGGGGTPGW